MAHPTIDGGGGQPDDLVSRVKRGRLYCEASRRKCRTSRERMARSAMLMGSSQLRLDRSQRMVS